MRTFEEQKCINIGWAIDSLITLDFHSRGIIRDIYACMTKKLGGPLTTHAANELLSALKDSEQKIVLIGTGFLIKPTLNPETDGPISSALIARTISLLGGVPVIVSQKNSMKVLKSACAAAELNVCESIEAALITPHSVAIVDMPAAAERTLAEKVISQMLALKPAAMISIEHPGKGADGKYYSTMGYELEGWPGPIDDLFEMVSRQGGVTIGIGDAGNEIGMGYIKPDIDDMTPYGALTSSVVSCSAPIIASVSEFGAYGLIAALQFLSGKKLLHKRTLQEEVVRAAILAGCVDGCTGKPCAALDMIDLEYVLSFIHVLEGIVVCTEAFCPTRPFFIDYCRGADIGEPGQYTGGHGR